ncbi:unnamed protein product [Rhodiola kirilowii]
MESATSSVTATALVAVDPLYLSPTENISTSLVTTPLTGAENYISWRRSIEMVLDFKHKLKFVKGGIPKPTDEEELERWMRCSRAVQSWLISSISPKIGEGLVHAIDCVHAWRELESMFSTANGPMIYAVREEIAALRHGDMNVETYYGKLKKLRGNEEAMSSSDLCDLGFQCKSTKCVNERKVLDKVMKFLMGLNDCYMQIRTQILAMEPLPSIEKVYSMVSRDEIQRGMKPATTEVSAMFTSNFGGNNQGGNKQVVKVNNQSGNQISGYTQPSKKWRALFCQHCQMPGHTKETCYKLHGYPPGHKFYKGPGNIGKNYKSAANNVVSEFNIAGQEGNDDSG